MNARIAREFEEKQKELSPGQRYEITKKRLNKDSLIQNTGSATIANLQKSYSKLSAETLENITSIILSSNRKYVAAFRGAACCAQYMVSKLLFLTPNVTPITQGDSTALERLMDIDENDCLILYSFPRYSEINFALIDLARERKAKIVLITDQVTSPLANKADIVVTANVQGLGFTNSYVVPISISEMIVLAVSEQNDVANRNRMKQIDEIVGKHRLY